MEGFGAYLKREREMRGIGLREIAQTTKIPLRFLEALECDDFAQLGGEIFVRGFLRNYAKYLGLDPEDIVLRYDEFRQANAPAPDSMPRMDLPQLSGDKKALVIAGGAGAVFVGIIILLVSLSGGDGPTEKPEKIALATYPAALTDAVEAVTSAAEVTAAAAPSPVPAPAAKKRAVELIITASQPSYLKLWIDEAEPVEREITIGGELHYAADKRIEILVGNAGGVTLELNGKVLPKIGPEGRVRRRVITAEGISIP